MLRLKPFFWLGIFVNKFHSVAYLVFFFLAYGNEYET